MKSLRFMLPFALLSLCAVAFAQSEAQKSAVAPAPSEAQQSFATMKTLAGEWEGIVTVPDAPEMSGRKTHASLRVTSRGHVLVHEFQEAGTPLDATKYDHPVTMVYLDADQLTLVHYCDAGNRPRMTGKMSPDGKTVEFEFKDISGREVVGRALAADAHRQHPRRPKPNRRAERRHQAQATIAEVEVADLGT